MKKENWIEYEREFEVVDGIWVPKKAKEIKVLGLNQKTKEIWDILFKFFAAAAIISPFLILSLQNNNEVKKQKKIELSQLYFEILKDFKTAKEKGLDTSLSQLYERITFVFPTKLALYNSGELNSTYDTLKYDLAVALYLEELEENYGQLSKINEKFVNAADLMYTDSSFYSIRRRTFIKDSARIKTLIYSLDEAISEADDDCDNVILYSSGHDTVNFKSDFRGTFKSAKEYLSQMQVFSDNLWDSLMSKRIPLNTDIVISSNELTKRNSDFLKKFKTLKKFSDSIYKVKRDQFQKILLKELK